MTRRLIVFFSLAAASCGDDFASGSNPDGGSCNLTLSVSPSDPTVLDDLEVTANVTGAGGIPSVSWSVEGPAGEPDWSSASADGLEITVTTGVAGTYSISAEVQGESFCNDSVTLNVVPTDAPFDEVTLRFTPLAGDGAAPPQSEAGFTIYQAVDLWAGAKTLIGGRTLAGVLLGPGGALPAYLRIRSSLGYEVEAFANDTGAYAARILDLPGQTFDVLVVPYGNAVPSERLAAVDEGVLDEGVTLDAGLEITGVVLDGAGGAVPGATVAVGAGELVPMVVVTAADGTFTARARDAGGALTLEVVPPVASGLPRLSLDAAAAVALPTAPVTVTLAGAPTTTASLVVTTSTGVPLAGARVTLSGTSLAGGTVTVGSGAPVDAVSRARVTVVSDAAGDLPALTVPFGLYDVIVEPPAGGVDGDAMAQTSVDLSSGAPSPAPLATAAATATTVTVRSAIDTLPVAGVRVTAVARGLGGLGAGVAVVRTTDAGGTVVLPLAPAVVYDLLVQPAREAGLAQARGTASGATDLTLFVEEAIHIRGEVAAPSGAPLGGVKVEAFLTGGDGLALGETVTSSTGAYDLPVPSPRD